MTIEETIKQFIEDVNAEFGSDLAIDSQGGDGEISINWPGHGHIYVDAKTGEILGKTKLQGGLVDKLRGALGGNVPAVPGRGGQIRPASKAAQSLREIQDEEAVAFVVDRKSGKKAPTAALISRAANAEGLSFEVIDYVHRRDFVKVAIRASSPDGRRNDAVVSVYKDEYLAPYAWELAQNNCPSAVEAVDPETGMPIFREGATIRVPKSRDGSRLYEEVPAILWLAQKLAARWLFAPRSCETKAKSRAAKQLLNTDSVPVSWQEPEEIADEEMESSLIEGEVVS